MTSERLYQFLLKAYPGGYRRKYEEAMAQCFRDQLRPANSIGKWIRLWFRTIADFALSVPARHVEYGLCRLRGGIRNWWLLALCGLLCAIISVTYFVIYTYTALGPNFSGTYGTVMLLQRLTAAAGACTIAAGIWRPVKGKSWLLILNGLAFSAQGLIPFLWKGFISFRVFALLVVVMATAFGILAFSIARTLRSHGADKWFFGSAGTASVGFALAFLALASRWIQLERRPVHPSLFLWFSVYFGFSAICMVGLALYLHRLAPAQSRELGDLPPLGNPKHAD
jgi:hypothetical protein